MQASFGVGYGVWEAVSLILIRTARWLLLPYPNTAVPSMSMWTMMVILTNGPYILSKYPPCENSCLASYTLALHAKLHFPHLLTMLSLVYEEGGGFTEFVEVCSAPLHGVSAGAVSSRSAERSR